MTIHYKMIDVYRYYLAIHVVKDGDHAPLKVPRCGCYSKWHVRVGICPILGYEAQELTRWWSDDYIMEPSTHIKHRKDVTLVQVVEDGASIWAWLVLEG